MEGVEVFFNTQGQDVLLNDYDDRSVVKVQIPVKGDYVIIGKVVIWNKDGDAQPALLD